MFWAAGATAVLMPTTRPDRSTRGPPLLPGLRAASDWIRLYNVSPDGGTIARSRALTTPTDTVAPPFIASGLPMATTVSPIRRRDDLPSLAGTSPSISTLTRPSRLESRGRRLVQAPAGRHRDPPPSASLPSRGGWTSECSLVK